MASHGLTSPRSLRPMATVPGGWRPVSEPVRVRRPTDQEGVRRGGGVTAIRRFLGADLVATLYVAVAPVTLGAGLRLPL